MFLLLTSFAGGVLTVLAPCILPLLPVIVGGSLSDGKIDKKKAITVVVSLGISVILFTLILKVSTLFIHIPEYTWKLVSGGIILTLGIITLFPSLWESEFMGRLSTKSNILLGLGDQKKSFWGDVLVGASLGPVFSTCSPTYFIVLATVLPVRPILGIVYLLSYTLGLCLFLLMIAFVGQDIMHRLNVASDTRGSFKRVLGFIFIVIGIAIITGYDKKVESSITNAGFFDVTKIEQRLLQKNTESVFKQVTDTKKQSEQQDNKKNSASYLNPEQKSLLYSKAPELAGIDGYINTDGKPITIAELKGKVVLLDIWTYSCINCQRTLPYVKSWYDKYKDQGLVIIGVHTPEFGFEKVQDNVQKAVYGFGIKYPVVLDNEYATWTALGNQYWPRKYLIDIDGYIVYDHIGEGNYDVTEKEIQRALAERAARMNTTFTTPTDSSSPKSTISFEGGKVASPETYFGSKRNDYLANGNRGVTGDQNMTVPTDISPNSLYLGGTWDFEPEHAENKSASEIDFYYNAKNVYMAAGSDDGVMIDIYKDDAFVKSLNIKDAKLYPIIEGSDYGSHQLKIKIPKAGLQAFTFTFG
ncbi:MAG: redoxin family protein [bacterium]